MLRQPAFEIRGNARIEGVVTAPEHVEEPLVLNFFFCAFPACHAGNSIQLDW